LERPLSPYAKLFPEHGVEWKESAKGITISGKLSAGLFELPGNLSSQFVSGLLLALPLLGGESLIRLSTPLESAPYVDMTRSVAAAYGVALSPISTSEAASPGFAVPGGQLYKPAAFRVEPDFSQAAYFLCAAALGCDIRVTGLPEHSIQGDAAIAGILYRLQNGGDTVDASNVPDLVPPLAAYAACRPGVLRISGAGRLRYKESDRLAALCETLGCLGADIAETPDGLLIHGKRRLRGGRTDSHGDHRIAMAAALASLRCERPAQLSGWQCVEKSYPDFWKDWLKKEIV
jgi:3-phosphoshikimate 1-carboxyvinyltransferase